MELTNLTRSEAVRSCRLCPSFSSRKQATKMRGKRHLPFRLISLSQSSLGEVRWIPPNIAREPSTFKSAKLRANCRDCLFAPTCHTCGIQRQGFFTGEAELNLQRFMARVGKASKGSGQIAILHISFTHGKQPSVRLRSRGENKKGTFTRSSSREVRIRVPFFSCSLFY